MFEWFKKMFGWGKGLYDEYKDDPRIKEIKEEIQEKFKLKNGESTTDRRLDRVEFFDERSKEFPVSFFWSKDKKPLRSYTWRCKKFLNQGMEGACVGFGICHELAARPAEVEGLTNRYAREHIYWEAQKIDGWPGGAYPEADRHYEGTAVLAGVKIAHKLGYFDSYRWAFSLEDLQLGVGYNGPAVIGVNWYEGMFTPDEKGYIYPTGKQVGKHCTLVNAININQQRFTIHNSWGKNWGMHGECYISFEDMDKLLKQRGEVVFFIRRHESPDKVIK